MVGGNVVPDTATAQVARSARNDIEDPELRSLESRIGALRRAVDLDRRFLKPSVAAQIQYSRLFDRFRRYYLNFKPDDFSVGATVTLPLWTGGRRAASSARLAAQLDQLIAQRDARRTEMELAIREAEADVTQAQAEGDLAARAHGVAKESLRVAEEMEREGRGEVNDVPQAQIALAEADDDVANAGAHLVAARARLLVVRGELPEDKK
jgi:outer membrane protein